MAGSSRPFVPLVFACIFFAACTVSRGIPTLKVGITIPNVGGYEDFASQVRSGINAFLTRYNQTGGITVNGTAWGVEVIIYNDGGNTETSSLLYQHLIEHDGVDILIGPYEGPVKLRPTAALANSYGVPLINWADGEEDLGLVDWIFTTRPSYSYSVDSCLEVIAQQGAQTVCVSTSTELPHLTDPVLGRIQNFTQFTILSNDVINATNSADVGKRWASLHPDFIIGGAFDEENVVLFDQFLRHQGDAKSFQGAIFFYGANSEAFRDSAGWQAENSFSVDYWAPGMGAPDLASFNDPYFSTSALPDGSSAFAANYASLHGHNPDTIQTGVAHALEVAVFALNMSQSTDPQALRAALMAMNEPSIMGRVTFDPVQHRMSNGYRCLQYQRKTDGNLANADLTSVSVIWPAVPHYPKCWPAAQCPKKNLGLILGLTLGIFGLALIALATLLLLKYKYHIIFIGRDETAGSDQW